jgi:hypothetical protein
VNEPEANDFCRWVWIPDAADRYRLELYWLYHWAAHRIRLLIGKAAAIRASWTWTPEMA